VAKLAASEPALIAMATCHSLTIIENKIVGDPMDVKMFEFADWVLTLKSRDLVSFNSDGFSWEPM
jgi:magnesium-transporting ATPase (P-type)